MESHNGKQRRSVPDRRTTKRRDPERKSEKSVLSTRAGERRKKARRSTDRKTN